MRKARIAAVLAVLAMLVLAQRFGLLAQFADPARARHTLAALGPWGYVAFVLAYAALQPFGVPGTVFIFTAPMLWPWPTAFALSMVGTMGASVVGFCFARFVAHDALAKRMPARLKRYDKALAERGLATVFLLRLIFWMPPVLHAFFGVSKVRFSTHFWGSLGGYVLPLLAVSYFGQRVFELARHAPPWAWAVAGTVLFSGLLVAAFVRSRRAPDEPLPD